MVAGLTDSKRSNLRQKAKSVRVLEMAERVHLALDVAGMDRKCCRQFATPSVPVGLGE